MNSLPDSTSSSASNSPLSNSGSSASNSSSSSTPDSSHSGSSDSSILSIYSLYLKSRLISTDTRNLPAGCLFFALKGGNFNGNQFAVQALRSGAAYAVTDELIENVPQEFKSKILVVKDVLECLQDLARHHRKQLKIPVAGITGSNGKTTSKELLFSVMSQKFKTFATHGNLNNHIGVPLSILSIDDTIEFAVIEMGANHQKEIEFLCGISMPDVGLVTNVGLAHLEGFGGFEGVKKGKKELFNWLASIRGLAFIHADSFDLLEMSSEVEHRTFYGSKDRFTVSAQVLQNEGPYLSFIWKEFKNSEIVHKVKTKLSGNYNLDNALAAITVGLHFGLNPNEISLGIENYIPENNRSQIHQTERNILLLDYYNANPSSMAAAINHFSGLHAEKKLAILGDMFELGNQSLIEHEKIIEIAKKFQQIEFIFIGKSFSEAGKSEKNQFRSFDSTEQAKEFLSSINPKDYTILVKGSRGIQLEKLISSL